MAVAVELRPHRLWRRRRLGALIALVAVVLGLAVGGGYWMLDAHELSGYQPMLGSASALPIGTTQYITESVGPDSSPFRDESIVLERVAPVLRANTAGAAMRVLVCRASRTAGASESLPVECVGHSHAVHAGMMFNPRASELVVAVTPSRYGTIEIDGLQIAYRDGLRHGDQRTGFGLRFDVHATVAR